MSIEMQDLVSVSSTDDGDEEEMATLGQFERCLDACGFGKYQWGMLGIALFGVLANVSVMASMPYAFTFAHHIRKYDLEAKTLFYVIPYIGIIISSVIAGFLSDTFGRRKVAILSYAGLTLATLLEGMSQGHELAVFAKFFEGLFLSGAFVASTTLQAEFQTEKSRDRIMVTLNFFVAISHVLVLILGLAILPWSWHHIDLQGPFVLDASNIFILISSVFSLIACLLYALLPESPKFDFVHGRYKNALRTVKRIYSVNTGKSDDEFPYQILGMTDNERESNRERVWATWSKVELIFKKPLLKFLIVIMAIQMVFTLGYNTIRLWHPTIVHVFEYSRWEYTNSTTHLCAAFERINDTSLIQIHIWEEGFHHILNSIFIFVFGLIPYIVVTIFINVGKKRILLLSLCVCCCCIVSMYWIYDTLGHSINFFVFVAFGQVFVSLMQAFVIEIFPVSAKSFALSLALMASAVGVTTAEVMFSSVAVHGCAVPAIVASMIACAATIAMLLPKSSPRICRFRRKNWCYLSSLIYQD